MAPLSIDIDRLSDRQKADLATKLWKQLIARGDSIPALVIRDNDQRPIGYLIPASGAPAIPDESAEFIAETFRRIDNLPERFLTVDEFLASLHERPSAVVSA
jgi:hypothetical protein